MSSHAPSHAASHPSPAPKATAASPSQKIKKGIKRAAEVVFLDVATGRPVRKFVKDSEQRLISDWIEGKIGVDMLEASLKVMVIGLGTWVRASVLTVCLAGTSGIAEHAANWTGIPYLGHGVKTAYAGLLSGGEYISSAANGFLEKGEKSGTAIVSIPATLARFPLNLAHQIIGNQAYFLRGVHTAVGSAGKFTE